MTKRFLTLSILVGSIWLVRSPAQAEPRILKFSGVPLSQASSIKKRFPFVFEREVTLSEVDEVVRYLMSTGNFSNIEVIERQTPEGLRELVLVAGLLRRIREVQVRGNSAISTDAIIDVLDVTQGETFERKDLLAAADELRRRYEQNGFNNAKVEIEFNLPSDNQVDIDIKITEGLPVRIAEITMETQNSELSKRLSRMARGLQNQVLSEDALLDFQKNVNEYLQDNRYLTARLSSPVVVYNADRTQAKLTYTVENPWRFKFLIRGNLHFSDFEIIRRMELDKFSGAISSPAPDLADRIRRAYEALGFVNIVVDYKETFNRSQFVQEINFNINEGPRVRIKKIEISGNISRPPDYYRDFVHGAAASTFSKGYYNRKEIDDSTKKMIIELQNQGFLRARVQSQRAEFSKDKASATLFLTIDEGPLTQVRQIKFEGVAAYQRSELLDLLKIKTGSALSLKDLEESIATLKNFYRSEGFLEMRITNETEQSRIVTYNDTNTQATVEFQIHEGPRILVASVSLQGNSFTKDEVIYRELAFKEGDVLTPDKIETSIFHLQRLGLFSRVDIRTLEEGTNIANRTVVVEIGERDPGLFTMGLGVNNEQKLTFRGYVGVAYRNLYGTGRAISFRVDPRYSTDPRINFIENKITVSYLEPYVFGDRNRGRVNIAREQAFSPLDSETETIILENNSIGLLLERDLTRHVKLTYTGYSFSNQRKFARANDETRTTQNIAKIGPLLEVDYRDDVFNPTKGSYSFVNVEYSDPAFGSSEDASQTIHFFKTNASVTLYNRLLQRSDFVWANSVRGGYLANLSGNPNSGVPSQEAFFLGGRSTIRGFDSGSDERIPSLGDLGTSKLIDFKVTKDSYYYLVKSELRFPIAGSFGGALFYDGGAVLISQPEVNIADPYRHSAGFGFRVTTPVGPVSLDFAWKLDKKPGESPFGVHFAIGTF